MTSLENSKQPGSAVANADKKLPTRYQDLRSIPVDSPTVAVVDFFFDPAKAKTPLLVDIDGDNFASKSMAGGDLSHGEVVSRLIEDGGINVLRINIGPDKGRNLPTALREIRSKIEADPQSQIKAVAIPLEVNMMFEELRQTTALPELTQDNIAENRETVIKKLRKAANLSNFLPTTWIFGSSLSSTVEAVDEISALQKKNIEVFISAGNQGINDINLLCLPKGTKPIFSDDFSSNKNSLNFGMGRKEFFPKRIEGGYDINDNGTVDVLFSEVSTKHNPQAELDGKTISAMSLVVPGNFMNKSSGAKFENLHDEIGKMALYLDPGIFNVKDLHEKWNHGDVTYAVPSNLVLQVHPTGEVFLYEQDSEGTLHFKDGNFVRTAYPKIPGTSFSLTDGVVNFFNAKLPSSDTKTPTTNSSK